MDDRPKVRGQVHKFSVQLMKYDSIDTYKNGILDAPHQYRDG